MCKTLCFCIPTPRSEVADYPVINSRRICQSPLDTLGFRVICCCCIPLKLATIMICLLTFIWAALEIATVDRFLKGITDDTNVIYYLKIVFVLVTIGLIVVSTILFLGVILKNHLLCNIYVWYVLVYTSLIMVFYLTGSTIAMVRMDKIPAKSAFRLVLGLMWYALVFYFLIIVNSYKSRLW